jgi:hypothetical protein
MWFENPLLTTKLQMELKRVNQRIVQIAQTFGESTEGFRKEDLTGLTKSQIKKLAEKYGRETSTFKQATAILQKGGAKPYRSTSKTGNPTIDIRKINKIIRSGKGDINELNQILSQTAGIKIDPETGDLINLKRTRKNKDTGKTEVISNPGIKTVNEIKEETRKKMEKLGEDTATMTDDDLIRFTEELNVFAESFESEYEITKARIGESKMKADETVKMLWKDNRGKKTKLTYPELTAVMKRMKVLQKEAVEDALSVEQKKGGNI